METIRHERGLLYEDFEIGQKFEHHWGRTFFVSHSVEFSNLTMNNNPLYFNAEYAREMGHRSIPINPLLVYVTVLGLSVEDLSEAGGPFLGVEDLEFQASLYDQDTVWASSTTLSTRASGSRPGWGVVEWQTKGRNQHDELVLKYRRSNFSRMRSIKG